MSSVDAKHLYQLLPAIYRLRDAGQGYPLRALIEVLEGQGQVVEADIARLYENWFIETCDEWVVPYIGDLLGVRGLLPSERAGWSQRALVAHTLQYRQRKGTVPLLEQLVHDVAGWAARAVEFYNEVGVTQFLDHIRPGLGGTANLRELKDSTLIGSAFDPMAYTPDVRLMSGTRQAPQQEGEQPAGRSGRRLAGVGQGRPNLPNIGLYIWRLKPYRIELAAAYSHGDGQRFSFSPLGNDIKLFNAPGERRGFTNIAQEYELPAALRNQALLYELEALQQALVDKREPAPGFLSPPRPAFQICVSGKVKPFSEIQIAALPDWDKEIQPLSVSEPKPLVVDPENGRIFFRNPQKGKVQVTYSYAFSNDIGGGPYDRRSSQNGEVDTLTNPSAFGKLYQLGEPASKDLGSGLDDWAKDQRPPAVIQVCDNDTYLMPANGLDVDLNGSKLVIQAANLCRTVIMGNLNIIGRTPAAELTLSGLFIAGQIRILGLLGRLTIVDCTLAPGLVLNSQGGLYSQTTPSVTAKKTGSALQVKIARSIVGPVHLPQEIDSLTISDSIIDAPVPDTGDQAPAIAGDASGKKPGLPVRLERVTVFGKVYVREMRLAEDVLFTSPVKAVRPDIGVLHNCYMPKSSDKFRCENCLSGSDALLPAFTSRRYGDPGYAQLSLACPAKIRTGGTLGAEIGVFHRLRQPQREAALLAQLEEYLRFGLEAGLIYVTYSGSVENSRKKKNYLTAEGGEKPKKRNKGRASKKKHE
jgi:hypothetical protein